jgi:uncharacterized protein involved in exopolysaccharide biosynthesis
MIPAVITTVAGIAVAFFSTPVYRAEVLISPVANDRQGSLPGVAELSGIAALAGISLLESSGNSEEAFALISSRFIAERLIKSEDMLPQLFAEDWDSGAEVWSVSAADVPSNMDGIRLFREGILRVSTDDKTGLISVSIDWRNRHLATHWATRIIELVNETMRERDVAEAKRSFEYLSGQLAATSSIEIRGTINSLIEDSLRNVTLASVRTEYALRVVDPAQEPDIDDYVWPNEVLIIILAVAIGLILGVMTAFVRFAIRVAR